MMTKNDRTNRMAKCGFDDLRPPVSVYASDL